MGQPPPGLIRNRGIFRNRNPGSGGVVSASSPGWTSELEPRRSGDCSNFSWLKQWDTWPEQVPWAVKIYRHLSS